MGASSGVKATIAHRHAGIGELGTTACTLTCCYDRSSILFRASLGASTAAWEGEECGSRRPPSRILCPAHNSVRPLFPKSLDKSQTLVQEAQLRARELWLGAASGSRPIPRKRTCSHLCTRCLPEKVSQGRQMPCAGLLSLPPAASCCLPPASLAACRGMPRLSAHLPYTSRQECRHHLHSMPLPARRSFQAA